MESHYFIQTATKTTCDAHGESFLKWRKEIDDSVGTGKYTTYQTAMKHKEKFLKLWKRFNDNQIPDLDQTLIDEYKYLRKNDSRLRRARNSITEFAGIRILTHTLPTVMDVTVLETN
mgnify:CR=1 FL=1|tara:strand:+ start:2005 stop:2355 length:351 start_codon:yes stop_codon:yes gene_type:complete